MLSFRPKARLHLAEVEISINGFLHSVSTHRDSSRNDSVISLPFFQTHSYYGHMPIITQAKNFHIPIYFFIPGPPILRQDYGGQAAAVLNEIGFVWVRFFGESPHKAQKST